MRRRYRTRTDNPEWLNCFHNMKCLHTRLESGRQIAFRMNYEWLNALKICPFLRGSPLQEEQIERSRCRLLHHDFSASPPSFNLRESSAQIIPIVQLRRMAISSKLPVYWKSVCLKMKGFTPAAYTQSRFQHLPATARSSGSPRLPHPHLMMEIILY
ncbi:hypothetical protein PO909_006896 [Leuciscus waleckii]